MSTPDTEPPVEVTEREKALLEVIREGYPMCPYWLKQTLGRPLGIPGAHGPDTCAGGCHEAPECMERWEIAKFPDLCEALVDMQRIEPEGFGFESVEVPS